VDQSQKGHPWESRVTDEPSEASHGVNHRHFHTETAVADGGDVAVHVVKGSLSDASASGWNRQSLDGVRRGPD
jgi:hypothetical protein